ncbi:NADH dehydrogenase [ubiquinone] 1 beta subcomplex subunit 5, mitochondrial [Pseudolycoriella hygida]|uniref:NADH dehydrogenase [ubiquinone] 1 beta subcomplex subunit 5, mitochondrial n=1 Tax=Pseudolycoriella hygida TaxID=35572 RepID=A0A9Q0N349_9DIPT|nr:NADH dehydrogenase [ubiquinone] 1 beta subcomplex subunit 5, mitochondrial [Pseudolycoriella hygida]
MEINEIQQLERNFRDHNYSFFINTKIESAHILYTNLFGIFNDHPSEIVDIQSRLVAQIESDECRSFVVFGDAGSGKTSLALHLCNEYWKAMHQKDVVNRTSYIPIYISLRQIELQKDCKNILTTFCDISPGCIKAANLDNWNLLLFLDGYDELEDKINLWNHNNWWLPERRMKIKTLTFCKTIGLRVSERGQCFTFGYSEKSKFISIQKLGNGQIDDYVQKTVAFLRNISASDEGVTDPWLMTKNVTGTCTVWENDSTEYKKWLHKTFPDLNKLARNPYLLTTILQILPGIVEDCKRKHSENNSKVSDQEKAIRLRCSTEVEIYDEFVSQWFRYQATKNRRLKLNPEFIEIPVEHIAGFMLTFAQNLAFSLVLKNGGFLGDGSISETDCNLWHLWKPVHNRELLDLVETNLKYSTLFPKDQNDNEKWRLRNLVALRDACFLSSLNETTFKFFHSSLVEYLSSREVFENIRSRFNFYLNSDDPIYDSEFGINVSNITDRIYFPLLANLAQRAQTNESFRNLLFEIIEKSKEILILSQMSANAMTILSVAGICLSGRNFRNVQIAGANLSGGNFANSDFQFSNLAGVNVQQSWMVGCKFQGANFDRINFGQSCSVNFGMDSVIGMVPYTQNEKFNLIISFVNEKVLNYGFADETMCGIEGQKCNEKCIQFVEGNVLLTQNISDHGEDIGSPFFNIAPFPLPLTVNVWHLGLNKPLKPIAAESPNPTLNPTKYWISEELLQDVSNPTPSTSDSLQHSKEPSYYYEIQSYEEGDVGLVILWGYIVKEGIIAEYRTPHVLKTFEILHRELNHTIFKVYSDYPISSCDIYLKKLVAVKGTDFISIFSVVPTEKIIFKEKFPVNLHDLDWEDIKFSCNGRYLTYRSDFIYLCNIVGEDVERPVKLLEADANNYTNFFVVYDRSSQMAAFSYDDSIFICALPDGTIIQKMYTQNGLLFSSFPTFAFIDEGSGGGDSKLFSYVSNNSIQTSLETIVITEASEKVSHQNIEGLSKFVVSMDNQWVASFDNIDSKSNILTVYTTPVCPQSLLFRKKIDSSIYDISFTPHYLLLFVTAKVLVVDLQGKFYKSIEYPSDCDVSKFVSPKYQQIVLCINETIQLCKIVESGTAGSELSPVSFENSDANISVLTFRVGFVHFDSKDGSHILVGDLLDRGNTWLWMPSKKSIVKITQTDVPRSLSLAGANNFYITYNKRKRKVHVSNYFGYFVIKLSIDNSVKPPKNGYCLNHQGYKNIKGSFHLNVDWYVYGNSDGKLFIHYLKNNELLAELLFPHPVTDFNLHLKFNSSEEALESADILAWDLEGNISSLSIDEMNFRVESGPPTAVTFSNWKLNWTVKSNFVLNLQNSTIAKTFKVNESSKRLLHNFNASTVGEPWPEKIQYFSLSELYTPITEAETKFAIINTEGIGGPRMPIMADMWVVSVVARNSELNSSRAAHIEHVGLLIEGINNGRHFTMEAELTANKSKGYVRIKLVPVDAIKRLEQLKTEYIARQWMRPKSDVQRLIESIQKDQLDDAVVRHMSDHAEMNISPSRYQWDKFKDMFHFSVMVGLIPVTAIIFYANVFIGPATLTPIPEGYVPKHWEYYRHPISRFLSRYIYTSPQQEYEKYLHFVAEEKERMMLRDIESKVKAKMAERRDYQAYYYKPIIGKYHRVSQESMQFQKKLQGDG